MSDRVHHDELYRLAESHAGYFTAGQAVEAGMSRSTLSHHARPGGRFERVLPAIYRLRQFPSSAHEHVVAAWLGLERADAVVSHETAIDLHDLADLIPATVHVIIPRSNRGGRPHRGVQIHTSQRPPRRDEIVILHGLPVTTPERSILDSLQAGTQPEQIEMAIRQALGRGLTTRGRLATLAGARPRRVAQFVEQVLGGVE
jgi:predicted transcriptional regulator of viral defense system